MTNHCGTCTACCRVFAIPEFSKPAGKWCEHCDIGHGCKIYDNRPSRCVEYECLWLQSRNRGDADHQLADELRPDRCRVVFSPTTNEKIMAAIEMTPGAAQRKPVQEIIAMLTRNDYAVSVGPPATTRVTLVDKFGKHEVLMTEPDADGMQWRI